MRSVLFVLCMYCSFLAFAENNNPPLLPSDTTAWQIFESALMNPPPPPPLNITNASVYCTGSQLVLYTNNLGSDLIVNGKFSAGNVGFTSDYNFTNFDACGAYGIKTNAQDWGVDWCTDHTSGTGNMFIANPSTTYASKIWGQVVPVLPNSNYKYSMWVATPYGSAWLPSSIQVSINNVDVTAILAMPNTGCSWQLVDFTWNSGASTSADIKIKNMASDCQARDILLDDISFISTTPFNPVSFSWSGPNGFTSTLRNPIINSLAAANAGTYTVTATNNVGVTATASYNLSVINACLDCEGPAQIVPTNLTDCTANDGKILFTTYGNNATFQVSINGIDWFPNETTFTGLAAGVYFAQIRRFSNQQHCRTVKIELVYIDNALFTSLSATNSNSCSTDNGTITINGLQANTQVAWISAVTPNYVNNSTLSGGNLITNLTPGRYYVQVRRQGSIYCVKELTVEVGVNIGTCFELGFCNNGVGVNRFPNGSFGSGTPKNGLALANNVTEYGYTTLSCSAPDDGLYAIVNNTACSNGGAIFNAWEKLTEDHTPGDVNGYMMLINASFAPDIVFERNVTGLCTNTQYQFSVWVRNIFPPSAPVPAGYIYPNLTFLLDGVGLYTSGPITTIGWVKVGFTYTTTATSIRFAVRNNAPGGFGNDWLLDDIFVGTCAPNFTYLSPQVVCPGNTATLSMQVVDDDAQFRRTQWELSTDGGITWNDYQSSGNNNFNGNPPTYTSTLSLPSVTTAFNNYKYRLAVATTANNLNNFNCRVQSDELVLSVPSISVNLNGSNQSACVGGGVAFTANVVSSGAYTSQWQSSTDNVNWTNIPGATSTTYTFSSATTGTYYVRIVATILGCVSTSGALSITVNNDPTANIATTVTQVCVNGSVLLTGNVSGGSGTCVLQWQFSVNNTTWIDIPGAVGNNYTTPGLNTGTFYRAKVVCTGAGCCE